LNVSRIAGRVVFKTDSGEVVLQNASVTVLDYRSRGRVLATSVVDSDGRFAIDMRPGKYLLRVECETYAALWVETRVKSRTSSNDTKLEIVVTLGVDFAHECGGSHAEVRWVQPVALGGTPPPN